MGKGNQENKEINGDNSPEKAESISPVEQPPPDDQDEDDQLKPKEGEEEEEIRGKLIQGKGCLRGCLTPLFIIFGIILILFMGIYVKRDAIHDLLVRRILANTQKNVLIVLPEDMGKDEIEEVFENIRNALREKQIDEENLTRVISEYHDAIKKDISADRKKEEIDRLIQGLRDSLTVPDQT